MVSTELDFAVQFAQRAGRYMREAHGRAVVSRKLDRTVVTDVDVDINNLFIEEVRDIFGSKTSVAGEEVSARSHGNVIGKLWVIDPVDGTGEYVDSSIPNAERTSCVGIAMLEEGDLQLSVVYNPFRNELFVAQRTGGTTLNGRRLDVSMTAVSSSRFERGLPYDYCQWDGGQVDARFLEKLLGEPLGSYSAINQACDVARGRSAFAVFPGDTIHDIAPAAMQVLGARAVVSDIHGERLQWNNLRGAVYAANPGIHAEVIRHLAKAG